MLTTQDVANRLHASPYTIAKYARAGRIDASFIGRRWLFTEAAVERFVNDSATRTTRARRRRTA